MGRQSHSLIAAAPRHHPTCGALLGFALAALLALAACTQPNPEYQPTADFGCQPGQRICSGQTAAVCVPPAKLQTDRVCPATSVCNSGVCVPGMPACEGTSCERGFVCTVFVNPTSAGQLGTFCTKPVGAKASGASCASAEECQTGFCVAKGKVPTCYRSCGKARECPGPGYKCVDLTLTVNGLQGTVAGCVPIGG